MSCLSMIVQDLNFFGSGRRPNETNAKLSIYPNAVLTTHVALQGFQAITRRYPQIIQSFCTIEYRELSHGRGLNIHQTLDPSAFEKCFRVSTPKRSDRHRRWYRNMLLSSSDSMRSMRISLKPTPFLFSAAEDTAEDAAYDGVTDLSPDG